MINGIFIERDIVMGTNPVTSPITNETLRQRALELKTAYSTIGTDFSTPVTHKDTNGALFTFKKDATTGEVTCTYTSITKNHVTFYCLSVLPLRLVKQV